MPTPVSPAQTTLVFLAAVAAAADLGGRRGRLDIFADRLVRSASAPTLDVAMEHLLRSVQVNIDAINPPVATHMLALAGRPDGPRILRWWRDSAKLVTLLAATRDQALVEEVLAGLTLPEAEGQGVATPRRPFDLGVHVRCETALSHGADTKAGNATLLRRMSVLTDAGSLMLPYYAGNALRGQLRDLLADDLLRALGLPVSRNQPSVALWFFYALYSGGALEEKSDATAALRKMLGDHGAIRADGLREFRAQLPNLSLLGCALGNRIPAGRLMVNDLRPICREWGTGTVPVHELTAWEYLTRREDHEDHLEHHGMIATTEVLRAGTELEGGIDLQIMTEVERAACAHGLTLLAEHRYLGAENRRGLGRVAMTFDRLPDPAPYREFLVAQKSRILAYLDSIGALAGLLA